MRTVAAAPPHPQSAASGASPALQPHLPTGLETVPHLQDVGQDLQRLGHVLLKHLGVVAGLRRSRGGGRTQVGGCSMGAARQWAAETQPTVVHQPAAVKKNMDMCRLHPLANPTRNCKRFSSTTWGHPGLQAAALSTRCAPAAAPASAAAPPSPVPCSRTVPAERTCSREVYAFRWPPMFSISTSRSRTVRDCGSGRRGRQGSIAPTKHNRHPDCGVLWQQQEQARTGHAPAARQQRAGTTTCRGRSSTPLHWLQPRHAAMPCRRTVVPLKAMCSRKWAVPLLASVS